MSKIATYSTIEPANWKKEKIKKDTEALLVQIGELSKRLYAECNQSLLVVLQGMDASGKDGLVRELFKYCSPAWVNDHRFTKPTDLEYRHDFLWRVHQLVPEHGIINVFNRSHYEDILVPSVYGYIDSKIIDKRYEQINQFELYLEQNNTRIIKLFLNVSKEKQEEKLLERTTNPDKFWKHNDGDWDTRERWEDFMQVYDQIFAKCNKVPWHIIPSDKNWVKLYSAAKILVKVLQQMNPQFPPLESERFK